MFYIGNDQVNNKYTNIINLQGDDSKLTKNVRRLIIKRMDKNRNLLVRILMET